MALNPNITAEQFQALNPILQAEYRAEGEGYRLDVTQDGDWQLADTRGLLNTVEATRRERNDFETQLRETQARFEGVNLDELRGDQTRLRELLAQGDPSETAAAQLQERERVLGEQFATRQAAADEAHQTAIGERDSTIGELEVALDRQHFRNEATAAIIAVDPEAWVGPILDRMETMTQVKRGEKNSRTTEVVDEGGTVRYESVDGSAVPMGLDKLVKELQQHPELGRAFSGGNASGSGASSQIGSVGGPTGENVFDPTSPAFNLTKQVELLKSNPQEAARLQALAPKPQRQPMLDAPRQPSGGVGSALNQ